MTGSPRWPAAMGNGYDKGRLASIPAHWRGHASLGIDTGQVEGYRSGKDHYRSGIDPYRSAETITDRVLFLTD
tara:strand:+ start:1194 stop:1412 length:219 start_codon:yes stop_codon:yes gene_type:complete